MTGVPCNISGNGKSGKGLARNLMKDNKSLIFAVVAIWVMAAFLLVPGMRGPGTTGQGWNARSWGWKGPVQVKPRAFDMAVRLAVFEARNQPEKGIAAVLWVMRNRVADGRFCSDIRGRISFYRSLTSCNAYEPWYTRRKAVLVLAKTDPAYMRVAKIARRVFAGTLPDPTDGRLYFANPQTMKKRGDYTRKWQKTDAIRIGDHVFYRGS